MRGTPGVYVLVILVSTVTAIRTRGGRFQAVRSGLYLYVGSAMSGLEHRLARHLSAEKRRHWHIDYLLDAGQVRQVWVMPCKKKLECAVAGRLGKRFEAVPGFGSSDCRCRSHLFRVADMAPPPLSRSSA